MRNPLTIGIAIPTYKNAESLKECLNSIKNVTPKLYKTIRVVDDSGNGSVYAQLNLEFSDIKWIIHERNVGFGKSANRAIFESENDIVILLNDDIKMISNPIDHLQTVFEDESLFAVTFQSMDSLGKFREGANKLVWRFGLPKILHNKKDQCKPDSNFTVSSYAVGGHAAYNRNKFLSLKGFDSLYDPFYWEDVDICQRACKNGWKTIYLKECVVEHCGSSAIRSSFEKQYIQSVIQRNRILFAFRHLSKARYPLLWFSLLCRIIMSWLKLYFSYYKTVKEAISIHYTNNKNPM